MVRFLTDEDFNGRLLRGLLLRKPQLDVVRVQDAGLSGAADSRVLEWAELQGRILLTHDASTMPVHLRQRFAEGLQIPGVLIVDDLAPIARCIEYILMIEECSDATEWLDQVVYLPFR